MGGKNGTGGPIGTYTNFPPLLIPVAKFNKQHPPGMTMTLVAGAPVVKQTAGADPKNVNVPPGVFKRVPAAPMTVFVALNNPKVLQVRTTLSFSAPAKTSGTMTFKAGQRVNKTTTYNGTPARFQGRVRVADQQAVRWAVADAGETSDTRPCELA